MISVILPVYNGQKYIRESIESVIQQDYIDWELLIIDDGSTDNTASIIKDYINEKIHYHYQLNQGPSAARNYGISLSKGEYIAFIDADDLYMSDKLSEQLQFIEKNPETQIVYCDARVVNNSLDQINVLKSEGLFNNKEDFLAQLLFRQIVPLPQAMLLKKDCFKKLRYNENYINAEDYDLTIELAKLFKFGYLARELYVYRRHENNLTNSHEKQVQAEKKIIQNIGISNIKNTVMKSSFPFEDKVLLLAKIFMKIEYYEEAIQLLNELIPVKSQNPLIYFYMGNCAYAMNEAERAEYYYRHALTYDDNMAEAYNNLGCLLVTKNSRTDAEKLFNIALDIRENYMDAFFNRGQLSSANPSLKITWRELRRNLTTYI
ncbi:glycosyltransferase family 2 protein [Cytobacillus gottheilii]|uniref:glycosyltransferase family 2 protein n=1 Tax=Cytobacillus gottheilii TaxID=859144 RepID=UPI0009B95295|nr:glycosyltransferase [Cytobacillus gottheilii]